MKTLNRQTVGKIKKMSTPAAIFMIISTIVSGIGTVLRYKDDLFPNACDRGWMSYDNYCYLNTKIQLSVYGGAVLCANHKARIPKANFRHLKVISLTYGRDFWVSLTKQKDGRWIDINTNKTVNMDSGRELAEIKKKNTGATDASCYVYKLNGIQEILCNVVNYVICMKRFYK
ncbi:IEV and EEV membrane glycoprotein [Myxoma virus]|nr:m122R [Myxoma virus]AQT38012.1 IEV and EEV membrane glycoprotein [Myxoma virus]